MSNLAGGGSDDPLITGDKFTPLIKSVMKEKRVNCAELARRTGIDKSKLSRGLNGNAPLSLQNAYELCYCLDMDVKRAIIAITYFGDVTQYNDLDITVVADLMKELPSTIAAARRGCNRVPISNAGVSVIANHISLLIAENDRKATERREMAEFADSMLRLRSA